MLERRNETPDMMYVHTCPFVAHSLTPLFRTRLAHAYLLIREVVRTVAHEQ